MVGQQRNHVSPQERVQDKHEKSSVSQAQTADPAVTTVRVRENLGRPTRILIPPSALFPIKTPFPTKLQIPRTPLERTRLQMAFIERLRLPTPPLGGGEQDLPSGTYMVSHEDKRAPGSFQYAPTPPASRPESPTQHTACESLCEYLISQELVWNFKCPWGFRGRTSQGKEPSSISEEFEATARQTQHSVHDLKIGFLAYQTKIGSWEYDISEKYLLWSQKASSDTQAQLEVLEGRLKKIIDASSISSCSREVDPRLRAAFAQCDSLMTRFRHILIANHCFTKVNFVLGPDKPQKKSTDQVVEEMCRNGEEVLCPECNHYILAEERERHDRCV